MAFNVQNFIDNIGGRGTLKNNSYEVIMGVPEMLRRGSQALLRDFRFRQPDIEDIISLRANQVTLPGINLDLTQTNRYGVGPVSRAPTNVNYTTMSIGFLETADHSIYKFFYEWTTTMFDFTGSGGNRLNPVPRYNTEYAAYYTTDILINVYRPDSTLATTVRVIDAFPSSISDKSLSWNDNNSVYTVDAAFNFKEWIIDDYRTASTPPSSIPIPDVQPINLSTLR